MAQGAPSAGGTNGATTAAKDSMPAPIVIVGPSGVGKSVLINKLQEVFPNKFGFSVSSTTRDPRPGEENGKHYNFTDMTAMKKSIEEGKFVEYNEVHGNLYGTSQEAVELVRKQGKVCILDIDVKGASNIAEKRSWEGTKFIFIQPPSLEELERRLRGRGTETEEKVQVRLGNAKGEIEFSERVSFFDHKFVLDGLSGENVPKEVTELFVLLQGWYPSLGEMPAQLAVLTQFRQGGGLKGDLILREDLERIFRRLLPGFTDSEVASVLSIADPDKEGRVDVQKFIQALFRN